MSKSNYIYVWDNVDNINHIIYSLIDFNSHTTYLYDMKKCSKEDEDCSYKSDNCVRKVVNMTKLSSVSYVFQSYCCSINKSFSKF